MNSTPPSLVVFSHLRWNFVFQRPQHVMTRFGARRPVLFIEEPIYDASGEARIVVETVAPGVTVCRPHTPCPASGFCEAQRPHLEPLVRKLLKAHAEPRYDLWFYTPMALPLAERLNPRVIVYDCMDELSAFKFAPPELLEFERQLLDRAGVVFTGGPSLYRAKKDRHRNCHCVPSSVDVAHFRKGVEAGMDSPSPEPQIPRPRLGFYGVIDERFDCDLLAAVARLRPEYQFVMVGPVVKIEESQLPQEPNIHFLGQRSYSDLPSHLAGWDVALLPFARNESTKFISPTKTVEYMAAGKPVVSTPITDVAEPYGEIVFLAGTAEEFASACDRALDESAEAKRSRLERYAGVLDKTSWDRTVEGMAREIERAAKGSHTNFAAAVAQEQDGSGSVVVIGAGPTGLSAAYHLGRSAVLVEANDRIGGWCRSFTENGFTFDYAGHIMFSNDPYVHEMYGMLLGDNVHWQDREAWIYSKNVFTRYPFQGSLYGLPADVIRECILGAVEARYGSAKGTPGTCKPGDPKDLADCCGDGIAEGTAPLVEARSNEPKNFLEFIDKVWGAGIAKHFAVPYNRKIWAVPLEEMETSWLGGRVPMPDLAEMIDGALSPKPKPMGPNARFGYPLRGGFQALMDGFLPHLQGEVLLNSRVATISASRKVVRLSSGREIPYRQLVSTMPLPQLIRALGDEVPENVRQAANGLRHTSVRCVNIGVGRERITEKHWIYYPEDTVFHRIFVQGNASPHCNPPGGFGITCEITYGPLKPLPCDGADLIRLCIDDCIRVGMIRPEDEIRAANQIDMPCAYVVYDHARTRNVGILRQWLEARDIHLAGRYSEWEYYNSDHAFLAGKKVAERVLSVTAEIAEPSR
jgi:UDP-galactopyranose mutase